MKLHEVCLIDPICTFWIQRCVISNHWLHNISHTHTHLSPIFECSYLILTSFFFLCVCPSLVNFLHSWKLLCFCFYHPIVCMRVSPLRPVNSCFAKKFFSFFVIRFNDKLKLSTRLLLDNNIRTIVGWVENNLIDFDSDYDQFKNVLI